MRPTPSLSVVQERTPPIETPKLAGERKYRVLFWEFDSPIKWRNVVFIVTWHLIAIVSLLYYLVYLRTPGIFIYTYVSYIVSGFGVTGGAHRYWTHRSYKAKLPLKIILLACYSAAGQNPIEAWVRDHRVHHKYSETDADPHNAKRGFFFSHVGWLMLKKRPEVVRLGKKIDCSDILEDPVVAFHQKHFFFFKMLLCFVVPSMIPPYLYGEDWTVSVMANCFVRFVLVANATWSVNSAAHLWGMKPYDKDIYPAENVGVSFAAAGEGYHNYHHTFPWDYRAAETGRHLNLTTLILNGFHKLGWAYDMKTATPELIEKTASKKGDGTRIKGVH